MKEVWRAKIKWIGRKSLPVGNKYCPILIPKGENYDNNKPCWSVYVINKEHLDEQVTLADIYYVSDSAPDNLFYGCEFELYEGAKLVGVGVIREIIN